MRKPEISSILRPIVTEVQNKINQRVPITEIKVYVVDEVGKHKRMAQQDRDNIVKTVNACNDSVNLIKYLFNSLLKFEGHGVIKY